MAWTKRQYILSAFEELGLASYIYDLTADQLDSALFRLDSMMASWNLKGVNVGWPISSAPQNSSINDETPAVPDSCNEPIILNLAMRLAPIYGKEVPVETKMSAKQAYDAMLIQFTVPNEMQMPATMPSGSGNKYWNDRYLLPPDLDPLRTLNNGQLTLNDL